MDSSLHCLGRLLRYADFKMTSSGEGFYIEAQGHRWHSGSWAWAPIDESIVDAYLHIEASIKARELIKNAEIKLRD